MQSQTFFLTESDSKFNQQKQLTVTEAGRAVKVETDLPHLVSLGSGRFSTAVTLHPLPEGKTTVGCMNADIIIRGRGIHPEHCYFIHERDVVMLFPISQLITVDGAKVTRPTVLSQGTMICFGRSSYFRFNHPAEAQHLKQEYFDIYSETYSTSDLFSKKEPLYANEEMSNSSATSTTEGSLSIPFYDNVSEIRASHDKKSANGDSQSTICDSSSLLSSDPDQTLSRYHGTCSPVRPLSPFHSDFVVFPDGSRRAINNDQFFDSDCMTSSDFFDEKASHIPRPMSPSFEGLTVDNWSGYDNVLELKEAMKKQETGKERTPEPKTSKSESLFSAVPLVNCNDKFSPLGVFISDAVLRIPKMEHDPLEKQASELPDKRKVTFSIKEAINTSPTVNNAPPLEVLSKPPSGKHTIDQFKRSENKIEKKFVWNKRNACPTTENEIPVKSSFFKSLIRSRSPSPSSKRSPSPTHPLNTDVARRLSEPLKKSFKNPDSSLKGKFMGKQSSRADSSSSDEDSLNSKSSVRVSSLASTCPDQTDPPSKPPDYPAHVVTVATFNTTDDEKSSTHLHAEHEIICNPLKMDLKSCNVNVSLDNYRGEKLFSRDTVTTSIAVPGVTTYQTSSSSNNLIRVPCDIKPSAEVKPRSNRKQKNDVPIYDRVYDGAKQAGKASSILDQAITGNRLSEDVIEFIDRIASEEKSFYKQSNNLSDNMWPKFVNETKQVQTGCASNSLTNMTNLVKENNPQGIHVNKTTVVMKSQEHPSMESFKENQSNSSLAINAVKPTSDSDKVQHSSVKTPKMSDDFHRIIDDKVIENIKRSFGHVDYECDPFLYNRSPSPAKMRASSSVNARLFQSEVVSSKPPLCESNKAVDEETSALFGVRRGVLRRMKLLKQKIEEIEEKERNIENLITRNSMSIDVLEMKQISEKDIKEFFSNATSVLDNLEEEGKKVEHQFMEANEYLTRIDKTIGEIEKRKKKNGNNNNKNDNKNYNKNDNKNDNRNDNKNDNRNDNAKKDELSTSSTAHSHGSTHANHDSMFQRASEPSIMLDVKISSGSSDNSSISGSVLLLDRSVRKTKGSSGSLNPPDNNAIFMPRNSTCRPLTRYFPVTDSSFDLKCYIEMSGHNLEMCKTVFVESFSCCGYLSKMGRKWKKWHKRWFVFDRTKRHLACYLNEPLKQHQQPRSACYFQSIRDVFADHLHMVKSPNPDFTFCVKLVDKNLFLMASSADAMRIWIDVLFTGAEAYQDVS